MIMKTLSFSPVFAAAMLAVGVASSPGEGVAPVVFGVAML